MTQLNSNQIYNGTLSTIFCELAQDTAADQKRMDAVNKGIEHLGARTYRAGHDWGFTPAAGQTPPRKKLEVTLQAGDLVKIFKTIKSGDVCWGGRIDFDHSTNIYGEQKGADQAQWSKMFFSGLPAKLVREDGRVIYGALEAHYETGMEGIAWSICEYGLNGYGALNALKTGDHMSVFDCVRGGEVEWEGVMEFSDYGVKKLNEKAFSPEIVRETSHMKTADWLNLSTQRRPVTVVRP